MNTALFEISLNNLNLFSFMLGMTFDSFLSWYKRTAFMYVVAYFMGLAFYYGTIKPITQTPVQPEKPSVSQYEYTPPLPMPEPKRGKK